MYKVVIADDEFFAAKLLEKYIYKYTEGFEVVGIFEDGSDVVKYLANGGDADVIITDIKMHTMSGIQLAKYIHTMNIDIPVIFVSAYSDFEYAKEALNYKVFGYLLKVIDINELKKMMQSLKHELDLEKNTNLEELEQKRECFIEMLLLKKFKSIEDMKAEQQKCMYIENVQNLNCTIFKIIFKEGNEFEKFVFGGGIDRIASALVGIIKCALNKKYISYIINESNVFYMSCVDDNGKFEIKDVESQIEEIFDSEVRIETIISGTFEDFLEADEQLFDFIKEKEIKELQGNSEKTRIVEKAIDYIKENLENNLCRDSVAKEVGLTPAYFGKVFKAVMGITFFTYLNEQRMNYAKKLLSEGEKTVDVCMRIGMYDEGHFRRAFKSYCGMTPAEYRKTMGGGELND